MKRKNPYTTLLEVFKSYASKIRNRRDISGFYYDITKIKKAELFSLTDLYYKIKLANELGYDTVLKATEIGIVVHFIAKLPDPPYQVYI